MPITVLDRSAKCPFYRKDKEFAIYCEGMAEGQHITAVGFRTKEDKKKWGRSKCQHTRWKTSCPYARMLCADKYKRRDENEPSGKT